MWQPLLWAAVREAHRIRTNGARHNACPAGAGYFCCLRMHIFAPFDEITPRSGFSFPVDPNIGGRSAAAGRFLEKQLLTVSEPLQKGFSASGE